MNNIKQMLVIVTVVSSVLTSGCGRGPRGPVNVAQPMGPLGAPAAADQTAAAPAADTAPTTATAAQPGLNVDNSSTTNMTAGRNLKINTKIKNSTIIMTGDQYANLGLGLGAAPSSYGSSGASPATSGGLNVDNSSNTNLTAGRNLKIKTKIKNSTIIVMGDQYANLGTSLGVVPAGSSASEPTGKVTAPISGNL
jgi:hypothetical protein